MRTSIQLPSPSGVRSISLSLSLVVVVVVVERELANILSLSVSLSVSVSLSLSLCVSYLPCPRPSWPRPSANSNSPLLSCRGRLNASRVSSVCFGLFCVVCFRSMSLPRFGNLWIFPSYHLGRRTGHESRRATSQEEEVEDLVSHHPSSWSVWGGRRQGVC